MGMGRGTGRGQCAYHGAVVRRCEKRKELVREGSSTGASEAATRVASPIKTRLGRRVEESVNRGRPRDATQKREEISRAAGAAREHEEQL
jgi:hypothetical protein